MLNLLLNIQVIRFLEVSHDYSGVDAGEFVLNFRLHGPELLLVAGDEADVEAQTRKLLAKSFADACAGTGDGDPAAGALAGFEVAHRNDAFYECP